jgi:hypothetical protein
MRKIMEALEGDDRLQQFKQKVEQQLEKDRAEGYPSRYLEKYIIPGIQTLMKYGEPNPNNILINPYSARAKQTLGEPGDYLIQGDPNQLADQIDSVSMKFIEQVSDIVGESINWQELYLIKRLQTEDISGFPKLEIHTPEYLLVGEGTEEIDEIRVYYNDEKNRYPVYFIDGQYFATENKLKKHFQG